MTARNVISKLLLAFVLVSIGFAVGKELTLRASRKPTPPPPTAAGDHLIVYTMHRTVRCPTCNRIEELTRQTLAADFSQQLKSGRIEWREVDFQHEQALAARYGVTFSSVVLVDTRDGKELRYRRLDDLWGMVSNQPAFSACLGDAIKASLAGEGR